MRTGIFTTLVMAGTVLGSEIMMGAMDMGYLRARVAAVSNFQTFSGALGGAVADPITTSTDTTRPFECSGSTFTDLPSAQQRSCANQHNDCSNIANNKAENTAGITVTQCDAQQTSCLATQLSVTGASSVSLSSSVTTTTSAVPTLFSSDASFDFFCDP